MKPVRRTHQKMLLKTWKRLRRKTCRGGLGDETEVGQGGAITSGAALAEIETEITIGSE